jgi:acyl-CoA thioester hydrolase
MTPRRDRLDLSALSAHGVPPASFLIDLHVDPGQVHEAVDHVDNVEYVRWLDRAAEMHADSLGFTRQWLLDRGICWFVGRHEIDYLAEARSGDDLVVATWVREVRRVRSWRDYVIVRPADGVLVCRGATLWVLVDLATRRATRIPPEIERRLLPAGKRMTEGRQGTPTSCTPR